MKGILSQNTPMMRELAYFETLDFIPFLFVTINNFPSHCKVKIYDNYFYGKY